MSDTKLPKHIRKAMRELVDTAYEREMSKALADLETQFAEWRAGRITCFRLNELIHEYHNGEAREIWKRYSHHPESLLPILVVEGVLPESEIPEEILATIRCSVDGIRDIRKSMLQE